MENQEGFERLVPYRTEKELKEATKWYNTVDCKKIIDRETIEMILYNALNKYAPWEDFCMDKRDVKGFFYINALAYALLTFKYLSSPYMTLENIMCDSKQGEAVEGNIGLKSKIKEFQEKCRGICNNNERWKERIREKVGAENRSEDQKIKIEHYVNLIKLPCTYIFFSQDKIKDFLAPIVREIVWNITEKKRTESIDYKMMRVLQLYTEYIDGRPPVEEWDEWMDDENEMATQRKRKERLMKQYDEFRARPVSFMHSASSSVPPKVLQWVRMICLASLAFFVSNPTPFLRPTCLPFSRAVKSPSRVRWCRSATSFSDCSKASLICSFAKAIRYSLMPFKMKSTFVPVMAMLPDRAFL